MASSLSSSIPSRPKFNSQRTSDRLREGAGLYLPPHFRASAKSNIPKDRVSVFKELGLDDDLPPKSCPAALVDNAAACKQQTQHQHQQK
ncbi:hypothetical protein CDD82_1390 [Ophiocordyceps australis]|uniref:Uncharacterized protein n=1 Tax=Ophiocordyceps australis TaxID=1399860 RepID=A0A2C5YJP2_9HYPO|nr:hypothetical protein CDD82_1390 [Ophiocordyceps australis]